MHKESKIFNKVNIILLTSAVYNNTNSFCITYETEKMFLALTELKCINLQLMNRRNILTKSIKPVCQEEKVICSINSHTYKTNELTVFGA